MGDHVFLKEWKKEQIKLIQQVHPEYDEDMIKDVLNKLIDKHLKNPECALNNNYLKMHAMSTVLDIYDFIDKTKPIIAGGGVLFKNQHKCINPPSMFLDGALKKRKKIKAHLKDLKPGSYEYMMTDLRQMTQKVIANSYYGASGNDASPFFNINTALATTSTGQALISTMMCSFESFYADNIQFYDVDDFVLYVYNSIHRKDDDADLMVVKDMPNITIDDLSRKVYGLFRDKTQLRDEATKRIIAATLDGLNDYERQELFYSSNLFDFIAIPSIDKFIKEKILYKAKSFKDANNAPDEIKDNLDKLWGYLHYWVVYNHPTYNRINRLKFQKRRCVLGIDTDSNFVGIAKFVKTMMDSADLSKAECADSNQLLYIVVNTMAYILTKYTQVILRKYAALANIPDDYAHWLNMKNEFLYLRILFTENKKNYTGIVRLREGVELIPEKHDTKGLAFTKSSAAPQTKDFFSKIIKEDILYADKISGSTIIKKVKQYQRLIDESLHSGEKTFLTPLSVKNPEAYKDPAKNQGIRGTFVWNLVYPGMAIELPDTVRTVPVKMEKLSDIGNLKTTNPDIYDTLVEGVYNNPQCGFMSKGISVICIPSQVDKVPDWILPYINTNKIIENNINKFHPVMKSLGIDIQNTRANSPHFTNIIVF